MNCGDPTPGEYCPTCGQRKVDVQVSVKTLMMEVLEDQFILDRRLPRTLGALFFKPGHMTVEHVNGRIVRYIHPFRLYLVSSLIFFLLLSFFSLRLVRRAGADDGSSPVAMATDAGDTDVAFLDSTASPVDSVPGGVPPGGATPDSVAGSAAPSTGTDDSGSLRVAFGWEDNAPQATTGIAAVDSALSHRIDRLGDMEPREAAETLADAFFNYAPTMMFILLPVFAGILKLLYIRRQRYYAEHFVFLLHVHSFVFLLGGVAMVVGNWVGGWLDALLWLWILAYIYLAMIRVYGQGWLKTFAKYWTLGWMYFWILALSIPVAFVAALFLF